MCDEICETASKKDDGGGVGLQEACRARLHWSPGKVRYRTVEVC